MPAKMVSVSAADGASASTKINPDYVRWHTHDQALLRYLLSSVTREVLMGITTASSSTEAWSTLEEMYGSKTRARSINTQHHAGHFSEGHDDDGRLLLQDEKLCRRHGCLRATAQ
jgi:hypothetical protein